MFKNLDHAEKIEYLMIVIKSICKENNLYKNVIIEDFIYLMLDGGEYTYKEGSLKNE